MSGMNRGSGDMTSQTVMMAGRPTMQRPRKQAMVSTTMTPQPMKTENVDL